MPAVRTGPSKVIVLQRSHGTVRVPSRTVVIRGRGLRGPAGPQGPQGPAGDGGDYYDHTQASPSASWVINHGIERPVHVSVMDASGVVVLADVDHGAPGQVTVTFPTPVTGSAHIS